jgi:hypothetical protein
MTVSKYNYGIARSLRTALVVVSAALAFVGTETATAAPRDALCWRSLAPETGDQDQGLAFTKPTLASTGPRDVWLAWEEYGSRILRWTNGHWLPQPEPTRLDVPAMNEAVIAANSTGGVVVAVAANCKDRTTRALHIARAHEGSWEWLGTPLISALERSRKADEPSIGFLDREHLVVAWTEMRDVTLGGLFVAQWDGLSWKRLGALRPGGDGFRLAPRIEVDAKKQIWLSWHEGRPGGIRVARWDGSTWHDIGRQSLEKLAVDQDYLEQPSLVVDNNGTAWLLWLDVKGPRKTSLALARWDGVQWTAVPTPEMQGGKRATVWSARMTLSDGVPIIAWSQADATDNHRLYVSKWVAGDRWSALLTGLHLVEGVSNVMDVRVAAADDDILFVSWDEAGKDSRRTRLVQAYACAPGETPAQPLKSQVERDTWPKTVDEAARRLIRGLDDGSKTRLQTTKKDQLIEYHHGWGTVIRNSFGLWRGNMKLLESCGRGKKIHPDDCSMIIIEAAWKLSQNPSGSTPRNPKR